MKILNKIMICGALIASVASCKKSVLTETPPQILTADNLYVNYAGFENGLNGLYSQVRRCRSGLTTSDPSNDLMFECNFAGVDNGYDNYASTGVIYNSWGALNNASVATYNDIWAYLYQTIDA